MPSSHLPRTPCDKFFYDFPCDFFCHRRWLRAAAYVFTLSRCDFFYTGPRGQPGVIRKRLCGDCTEIVQCRCSCRVVSAASARKSYGARADISFRTVPVRVLCNATYEMSTGYGLTIFFRFVKLLAKPNRRGRGARESVRKSHSRLLPPQGGFAEAAREGGYGQIRAP